MINAVDALRLPSAQPSKTDIKDCRAMMSKLREHIIKHMAFGGPPTYEVPFREIGHAAVQLLCFAMKRFRWNVNANLIAETPRFQGGQPLPHHWIFQMQPVAEAYDEVHAETLSTITEETQILDA